MRSIVELRFASAVLRAKQGLKAKSRPHPLLRSTFSRKREKGKGHGQSQSQSQSEREFQMPDQAIPAPTVARTGIPVGSNSSRQNTFTPK